MALAPLTHFASKAVSGLRWFSHKARAEIQSGSHRVKACGISRCNAFTQKVMKQKISEQIGSNFSKTVDKGLEERLKQVHTQ